MSRKKMTTVVGVIKFGYSKEPHDLASVVTACVKKISWSGRFDTRYVKCRTFRVLEVVCRKGVASVAFEVQARPGLVSTVRLGSAAVTAVWEACNYRFGEGDEDGLSLLPLENAEIRSGEGSISDLSADKLLNEMMGAAERFNHVLFGWLECDLFYRYVPCIGMDEQQVLAKMPKAVRRRYLEAKAKLFRWMRPKREPGAGGSETGMEGQS